MPGKLNLKIYKGETFRHTLKWQDASELPINLTGYTARLHVRKKIDDVATVLELTTENGGISFNNPATDGVIKLHIKAVDTAALTWSDGVYDLELVIVVDTIEEVTRLVEGKITVYKEVTRQAITP